MDNSNGNQSIDTPSNSPQAQKGRTRLILVLVGIFIFTLGLGIGWYVGSASRTPTIVYENAPEEMTESNISPTASTQEQIYSSDKYGFSFKYPAGIVLTDANPDWLTLEPTSGNWYISIQFSQNNELSNDLQEDSTMQELTQENMIINGSQAMKTQYYPVIEGKKDSFKLIQYEIVYPQGVVTAVLKSSLKPSQQTEYMDGVKNLNSIIESLNNIQ